MRQELAFVCIMLATTLAEGHDVTTEDARRLNLLQYVVSRTDLSEGEKAQWQKAIRRTFGGKAIKDGPDEGVTIAKSVISAAIFHQISIAQGARAAYDAYHDTYRWIPPPIAINYQVLAFQGRKPAASSRQLAYRFPQHFNEEMAPELVEWWDSMLAQGKISDLEVDEVRETLRQTRKLMRPMLVERLWHGAELQARLDAWQGAGGGDRYRSLTAEVRAELTLLDQELERVYRKVSQSPGAYDTAAGYYQCYRSAAAELGQQPKARPRFELPSGLTALPSTPPTQKPRMEVGQETKSEGSEDPEKEVRHEPERGPRSAAVRQELKRAAGRKPRTEVGRQEPDRQASPATPSQPGEQLRPVRPPASGAGERPRGAWDKPGLRQAPLPGDPLVPTYAGWVPTLNETSDRWVGTPYLWNGVTRKGVDCSAFVRAVYREAMDLELPRNSRAQYGTGTKVDQNDLVPGDLVFFDAVDRGQVTHVGVYLGAGQFVHASSSQGVTRAELAKRYHQRAYVGSKRVVDAEAPGAGAAARPASARVGP